MSNKKGKAHLSTEASSSDSIFDDQSNTSKEDSPEPSTSYRRRVLTQEGLSLVQREKLHLSGLEWTREILELGYQGLQSIFKNKSEAESIINEVSKSENSPILPSTGTSLLNAKKGSILTGCTSIDSLFVPFTPPNKIGNLNPELQSIFSGGLPLKTITEIYGVPGTGKTTFCFQTILQLLKDNTSEAIYLDSEGSIPCFTQRLQQMISKRGLDKDAYLKNIQYQRIFTLEELISILEAIKNSFLCSQPKTRLLIIDSVARLFMNQTSPRNERFQVLFTLNALLQSIAQHINVIVVNHLEQVSGQELSTKPESVLQSGLGDSWRSFTNHQILFSYGSNSKRFVSLVKSSCARPKTVQIVLTDYGIEGLQTDINHTNISTSKTFNTIDIKKSAFSAPRHLDLPASKKSRQASSNFKASCLIPNVVSTTDIPLDQLISVPESHNNSMSILKQSDEYSNSLSPLSSLPVSPAINSEIPLEDKSQSESSVTSKISPKVCQNHIQKNFGSPDGTLNILEIDKISKSSFKQHLNHTSRESSDLEALVTDFTSTCLKAPCSNEELSKPIELCDENSIMEPTKSQSLVWGLDEASFHPVLSLPTQSFLECSQFSDTFNDGVFMDDESQE